jgi:hypothetical protein
MIPLLNSLPDKHEVPLNFYVICREYQHDIFKHFYFADICAVSAMMSAQPGGQRNYGNYCFSPSSPFPCSVTFVFWTAQ